MLLSPVPSMLRPVQANLLIGDADHLSPATGAEFLPRGASAGRALSIVICEAKARAGRAIQRKRGKSPGVA